jgi:hypothetical protein
MTLDEALAERRAAEPGEEILGKHLAEKHAVWQSTLTRRAEGETVSREDKAIARQKPTPQQEDELVTYIEGLTVRHLPPTRTMIRNFAQEIAGVEVSNSWVTRFLNRHSNRLTSQWATGMIGASHPLLLRPRSVRSSALALRCSRSIIRPPSPARYLAITCSLLLSSPCKLGIVLAREGCPARCLLSML